MGDATGLNRDTASLPVYLGVHPLSCPALWKRDVDRPFAEHRAPPSLMRVTISRRPANRLPLHFRAKTT